MRKYSTILGLVAGFVILACAGVYMLGRWTGLHVPFVSDSCRAFTDKHTVRLRPDQITNAATIAAVGSRMEMPPYAVTVALATAFQESKMRNISHGDHDSIGLFQQRPSQGWGSLDELSEPRIAAEKFYTALARINGWEKMSVTDAAQAVQLSAHPAAYAKWETDARNLASALIGAEGSAVSCILRTSQDDNGGPKRAQKLHDELTGDFGQLSATLDNDASPTLTIRVGDSPEEGWQVAGWFVAKSREYGVREVRFNGEKWRSDKGKWSDDSSKNDRVIVTIAD